MQELLGEYRMCTVDVARGHVVVLSWSKLGLAWANGSVQTVLPESATDTEWAEAIMVALRAFRRESIQQAHPDGIRPDVYDLVAPKAGFRTGQALARASQSVEVSVRDGLITIRRLRKDSSGGGVHGDPQTSEVHSAEDLGRLVRDSLAVAN